MVKCKLSFNNLTESDLGFIKRYIVNESKDQSCVVIDYHSKEVIQFKFRDNKTHKDDYFAQVGSISDLIFENGTISLQNFSDNYDKWINELLLKEKENISNSNIYDEEYFKVGDVLDSYAFNMVASHSDAPSFKVKPETDLNTPDYHKLNVEAYGGMLCSTWFDRPLSIAGRVIYKQDN